MLSQWNIQLQKGRYHRLHMGNDKRSRRHTIIRCHAVIKVNVKWVQGPGRTSLISLIARLGCDFLRRIFRDLDRFRGFTFFMMGLHTSIHADLFHHFFFFIILLAVAKQSPHELATNKLSIKNLLHHTKTSFHSYGK